MEQRVAADNNRDGAVGGSQHSPAVRRWTPRRQLPVRRQGRSAGTRVLPRQRRPVRPSPLRRRRGVVAREPHRYVDLGNQRPSNFSAEKCI